MKNIYVSIPIPGPACSQDHQEVAWYAEGGIHRRRHLRPLVRPEHGPLYQDHTTGGGVPYRLHVLREQLTLQRSVDRSVIPAATQSLPHGRLNKCATFQRILIVHTLICKELKKL